MATFIETPAIDGKSMVINVDHIDAVLANPDGTADVYLINRARMRDSFVAKSYAEVIALLRRLSGDE